MNKRYLLIGISFLIILGLFTFSHDFNGADPKKLSVYQQFILQGDFIGFIQYALAPSVIALIALLFLFGEEKKP